MCFTSSASSLNSPVYSILPDTSFFMIDPPVNQPSYRYNATTGKWQVNYGFGSWQDAPTTELYEMLNSLDVATTSDISDAISEAFLSPEDLADTLRSVLGSSVYNNGLLWNVGPYLNQSGVSTSTSNSNSLTSLTRLGFLGIGSLLFGSQGSTTITRTTYGSNGLTNSVVSDLSSLFKAYLYDIGSGVMLRSNLPFLNTDGSLRTLDSNLPLSVVTSYGFAGLNSTLSSSMTTLNTTNSSGFSTLSSNITTFSGNNSSGLSQLHSDLSSFQNSNSTLLTTIDSTLIPTAGSTFTLYLKNRIPTEVTFHSLGDLLSSTQSAMLRDLSLDPYTKYLSADGQVIQSSLVRGLSDVIAGSFIAIGADLTGNSDGIDFQWVDWKNIENSRTDKVDNLLGALYYLSDIQNMFANFLFSHGTDLDIQERENMEDQAQTFVDDFTSSSGKGTPSVDNVSDTANMSGGFNNAFSGSSDIADIFNQLGDDGNYGFFSNEVQQQLNPMYGTRSFSDDGFVDVLPDHLSDLFNGVGSSW